MQLKQICLIDITISNLPLILNIETSTKKCSVALSKGKDVVLEKSIISEKYSHSEKLTVFIQEVMNDSEYNLNDLNAISVSKGPGSYTGLRIGVTIAKGLCYALEKPLLSVSTLKSMALSLSNKKSFYDVYCPMIDARRMEVFTAIYTQNNDLVEEIQAKVITKDSFNDLSLKKVLFFGDGALKCKDLLWSENFSFEEGIHPSAIDMVELSFEKYMNKDFEDVIYFEPFYLKDFILGEKK